MHDFAPPARSLSIYLPHMDDGRGCWSSAWRPRWPSPRYEGPRREHHRTAADQAVAMNWGAHNSDCRSLGDVPAYGISLL
jgi:hypothetical protein